MVFLARNLGTMASVAAVDELSNEIKQAGPVVLSLNDIESLAAAWMSTSTGIVFDSQNLDNLLVVMRDHQSIAEGKMSPEATSSDYKACGNA